MTTATRPTSKKSGGAGPSRTPLLWMGGALAALVALVVIISSIGGDDASTDAEVDDSTAVSQTNDVVVEGVAIPELVGEETAQGVAAPQIKGVGFDGEPVTLLESGTPTVIGFFAHWCPVCQREVDELSRYLADVGLPDDVNLIAVSTGIDRDRGNYPPSAWFESEGWPTPILTDDAQSSGGQSYGLSGFPFWAIVDADGNLVSRTAGAVGPAQLDAFIELARSGAQ